MILADLLEMVFCGCEEIQLEKFVSVFIMHFELEKSGLLSQEIFLKQPGGRLTSTTFAAHTPLKNAEV